MDCCLLLTLLFAGGHGTIILGRRCAWELSAWRPIWKREKSTSKSEAYLQRKFAGIVCAVKRVDVVAHLLGSRHNDFRLCPARRLLRLVRRQHRRRPRSGHPLDRLRRVSARLRLPGRANDSLLPAPRQSVLCRPSNRSGRVPDAKNSLINWLDLHEQGLPSAFQRNLSSRGRASRGGRYGTDRAQPQELDFARRSRCPDAGLIDSAAAWAVGVPLVDAAGVPAVLHAGAGRPGRRSLCCHRKPATPKLAPHRR